MVEKEEYIKELQNNYKRVKRKEWEQLFRQLEEKGIDWQSISFQSMGYDVDIDMISAFIYQEYGIELKTANESANKTATKTAKYTEDMGFWKETLPNIKSIAIIGDTGCLPKGTLVRTPNGIIPIERATIVLSYNFKKNVVESKRVKVYNSGLKQVIRVHTSEGIIRCSPEHKWIAIRDGEIVTIQTKHLNTTDLLLQVERGLPNDADL